MTSLMDDEPVFKLVPDADADRAEREQVKADRTSAEVDADKEDDTDRR